GLTLGPGHHGIAVAVGFLDDALGLTTCLGNHAVGVGLGLVLLALLVFAGADHVVEGFLHFPGRGGALHVHLGDGDAGAVVVQEALQALAGFRGHLLAALGQHLIHAG